MHVVLHVPARGDSRTMELPFTPSRAGTANIEIRISVEGTHYRSLSAEVAVGQPIAQPTALIRRDITATRADRIEHAPLLSEQTAQLDVLQDGTDAYISGSGPARTRGRLAKF